MKDREAWHAAVHEVTKCLTKVLNNDNHLIAMVVCWEI